jgi:PAS domain S-box-containing protein
MVSPSGTPKDTPERRQDEEETQDANADAGRRIADLTATLQTTRAALDREMAGRRRTEERLKWATRLLEGMFDSLGDIVGVQLPDHTIVRYNQACYEILGKSPAEINGQMKCYELIGRTDECPICATSQCLESKRSEAVEKFVPELGRYLDCRSSPILNEQGEVEFVIEQLTDITARKEYEVELKHQTELLQSIIDTVPVMIAIFDPHLRTFRFNRALRDILGWTEEDAAEGNFMVKVYPDPQHRAVVSEFMQSLEHGWRDFTLTAKDGSHVESSWANIRLSDDTWIGVGIDIRERKRAEEALRKSEHRFRALIEKSSDFVVLINSEGIVTYVSSPITNIDGFGSEALVGKSSFELMEPEFAPQAKDLFTYLIDHPGETRTIEVNFTGPRGLHVIEAIVTNRLEDPDVCSIVVNARDVTERKQMEEALKVKDERLRGTFENAPFGLFHSTPEGKFIAVNPALVRMLGYDSPEDLIGTVNRSNIAEALYADPGRRPALVKETVESHDWRVYENHYRRKDGQIITALLSFRSFINQRTGRLELEGFVEDITDRKRAEDALKEYAANLRRSNEDLERFAYVSSHDLQEPLRNVINFTQLLERRYKGRLDPDADEYIHFIVEGSKRMQGLISDLLEFSRVTSGGRTLEVVDVEKVLAEALQNLHQSIEEEGATVTHDPLPKVIGDATQIMQVFSNLIGNALKFRREELLQIHVSARCTGGMWEFSVADNGIGIAKEYFHKLFIIFQRLHSREEYPGTGIGLAIVKRIIDRHGGRIWVESEPGKGSTFYFTLPAAH